MNGKVFLYEFNPSTFERKWILVDFWEKHFALLAKV
jgi:hypothetical protein